MKILMLSWEYPPHVVGGLGKHVTDLVPALIEAGVEVHLVVPRLSDGAETQPLHRPNGLVATNGSRVYRVDAGYDSGDFFTNAWHDNAQLAGFCARLVRHEGGFDLIHNHDWLTAFSAIPLKNDYHLPLLTTIHATEMGRRHGRLWDEMQRAIHATEWWLSYEAWRIIACSHSMAWEIENYLGAPPDKIDVIPNGVDATRFDRLKGLDLSSFRLTFARPDQAIVYYVGRIVYEKGLSVLVDAMPAVLSEWPDVKLVIAGGGSYVADLRAKADALGVSDNIIFPGHIPDDVRDGLFKVADVAVFPSLYEPFGIVALEAMAAGTPVVVSDVGGLSEVVDLHETGIKVYPDNPDSLAWGILHTLRNPQWARQRAENAERIVRRDYTWSRVAELTLGVYEHIVKEAKAGDWAYQS